VCVCISIPAKTNCFLRLVESGRGFGNVGTHLAQWSYVVEYPERATVRTDS